MRLASVLLAALAVPILAIAIALTPYWSDMGAAGLGDHLRISFECMTKGQTAEPHDLGCSILNRFSAYGGLAILSALLGLGLIFSVRLASALFGFSRMLISFFFPIIAFLAILGTAILALSHAALIAGGIFLLETWFLDTVHPVLILIVAIAGGAVGFSVFVAALRMFRRADASVIGFPVQEDDAPYLFGVVERLSQELRTRKPDNIILGLDPNFFASSATLHTPFGARPLRGESLYLSLPLMRMLSEKEVVSIIGHELAHFSGADTAYSLRFAPVYRGLQGALYELGDGADGRANPFSYPARVVIAFILWSFSADERRISRKRELRADRIGASAGSAEDLARALVKLSMLGQVWALEYRELFDRVRLGHFSRNLSINFVERTIYDIDHGKLAGVIAQSLDMQTAHPTDSHPLTRDRIEALGLDPEAFVDEPAMIASLTPQQTMVASSENLEAIEERLTYLYQTMVVQRVGVDESQEAVNERVFSNLLSNLLAYMVLADGEVRDEEIFAAQEEAARYDRAFEPAIFKEMVRHPEQLAPLDDVIRLGNQMLTLVGARRLKDVLREVAKADRDIHPNEAALFERLDRELTGVDRDRGAA